MNIRTFKEELSSPRLWMFPVLLVIALPCTIIDYFSTSRWFCTFWGWHKAPGSIGFDGCSSTGKCPRCNKPVLCDSNGDWF